ncbi:hypothetical protein B9Z55_028178 [Caenorhabditis nigoni]|nr:hypothetical protein B9Z55_028178 [Caenorhabditis nigoni]
MNGFWKILFDFSEKFLICETIQVICCQQGFNVRAGTLVEDTVTTKDLYDFFLTTQVGQVGLARPTHYYVLWDTWEVSTTFWPTITHALT